MSAIGPFWGCSLVSLLGLTAVVFTVVFVALNYQNIRPAVVEYRPGDVVRRSDKSEPYGKILRHEPTPAYEIRLEGKDDTIWPSERIVNKAMVPMDAGELRAAGVGRN